MRRILFVDDEPNILHGLQRSLRSLRHEWQMRFAESGTAALAALAEEPFDAVVTDMRMPGMDGATLLSEVRQRYPQTARLILSGHSAQESILRAVGVAHQYLSKPCDTERLRAAVEHVCSLSALIPDERLRAHLSARESLPSQPLLYTEIEALLSSVSATIDDVVACVTQDPGMAAKILQLVNSDFFRAPHPIPDVEQAVRLLGMETMRALLETARVFSPFPNDVPSFRPAFWQHSLTVGRIAQAIAAAEEAGPALQSEFFTAGLLHDVGELALMDAEQEPLGATHPVVGAYLLGLWGLPGSLVTAAALHHTPAQDSATGFTPLAAVHVVEVWENEKHTEDTDKTVLTVDTEYLARIGLAERLPVWREIYGAMITQEREN